MKEPVVKLLARQPRAARRLGRGLAHRQVAGEFLEQCVDVGRLRLGLCLRRTDHEDDLAFHIGAFVVTRREFAERSAAELLEGLGQFAADGRPPVCAEDLRGSSDGRGNAMRGFEEDESGGNGREFGEPVALRLVLHRQKACEEEGIARQAGADEGRKRRRGARYGNDPVSRLDRLLRQAVARIGDERRTGIGDERHRFPITECCKQPRPRLGGIVLVIGGGPIDDAVAVQQHPRHPRVLAGEHIDPRKRLEGSQRDVAEIADRRCHEIKARLQRARRNVDIVQAKTAPPVLFGCIRGLLLLQRRLPNHSRPDHSNRPFRPSRVRALYE